MSAETKLELLGLVDQAVANGWAHTRACRVLDIADVRVHAGGAGFKSTGRWRIVRRLVARCTASCPRRSGRSSS